MKVTKLIREYIEESVTKKFEPALEALRKSCNLEEHDKVMESVTSELREIADQKYREALAPFYTPEGLERLLEGRDIVKEPYRYSVVPIARKTFEEKRKALQTAKEKAIKDILIELELGGTKADLDRLLSEVKVEV